MKSLPVVRKTVTWGVAFETLMIIPCQWLQITISPYQITVFESIIYFGSLAQLQIRINNVIPGNLSGILVNRVFVRNLASPETTLAPHLSQFTKQAKNK